MEARTKIVLRWLLAGLTFTLGVLHFAVPEPFIRIMPAWLPAPAVLVFVSGVAELCGALGLLIPRTRRLAGIGLVLLYVAVFPANVNQAIHGIQIDPAHPAPLWTFWLRLPFQALFIWIAWWTSRPAKQAA
jgi:uncharacterized membrane protein